MKYSVWCKGNRRELYDLSTDPYEQTNLEDAPAKLLSRLDAVLSVLVHCKGVDCAHPYGVLHPAGEVLTFEQVRLLQGFPWAVTSDACDAGPLLSQGPSGREMSASLRARTALREKFLRLILAQLVVPRTSVKAACNCSSSGLLRCLPPPLPIFCTPDAGHGPGA
jgi:hypothetical protein